MTIDQEAMERFRIIRDADAADPLSVLCAARSHVRELVDAWQRGVLRELDDRGGERSNRNMDVLMLLDRAITAMMESPVPKKRK